MMEKGRLRTCSQILDDLAMNIVYIWVPFMTATRNNGSCNDSKLKTTKELTLV